VISGGAYSVVRPGVSLYSGTGLTLSSTFVTDRGGYFSGLGTGNHGASAGEFFAMYSDSLIAMDRL
jgi:hypothetical protein